MTDYVRVPRPWFMFTGCALAIAILYWAQVILVPIACRARLTLQLPPARATSSARFHISM